MSDYMAIADVGETLRAALWNEMQLDANLTSLIDDESRISLRSPADLKEDTSVRLSVYLYRIVEDPHSKNRFPVQGNGVNTRNAPLTLDLYYLVTPLLGLPREQQLVLGKTMQILYDRATLDGGVLQGSLAGGDPLRVILNPATLEENTRVWQALEISYQLSVCYVVRVVIVDSREERFNQPVLERRATFGEPSRPAKKAVLS